MSRTNCGDRFARWDIVNLPGSVFGPDVRLSPRGRMSGSMGPDRAALIDPALALGRLNLCPCRSAQQLRQLGEIHGHPPRLIPGEEIGR